MTRLRSTRSIGSWRVLALLAACAAACSERSARPIAPSEDAAPGDATAPRGTVRSSSLRVAAEPAELAGAPANPPDASVVAPPVGREPVPSAFCVNVCAVNDAGAGGENLDDAGADDEDGGAGDAPPVAPAAAVTLTHGPMLGAVTDHDIKVWARGSAPGRFVVHAWPVGNPAIAYCSDVAVFDPARDLTAVATLLGLRPRTVYEYRLEIADESGDRCTASVSPAATLQTLPEANAPGHVRFAVAADVGDGDVPGFADIQAVAPDFVLMIGDNVYADEDGHVAGDFEASFALGQRLYHRVWGGQQFRSLFAEFPAFMIWDDHELLNNYWRGRSDQRYAVGRALFDAYQGSHNPAPLAGGELYYSFRAGDVGFFVLDTRTHRDSNLVADDADKSMLGPGQRQAFEEWLANDDSRVHVIVSSVLVNDFSGTGPDAWRSFATERDAWLDVIAAHGTANTFIVSGDQHWSAVLQLTHGELAPYVLYEFLTTPLHARLHKPPRNPDDSVLALDNTHLVFGVFDVDTRADPPELAFTMCAVGEPCAPHREAAPIYTAEGGTVPHSLRFVGGPRGFTLVREP
jgi:alkaline phosphatase D